MSSRDLHFIGVISPFLVPIAAVAGILAWRMLRAKFNWSNFYFLGLVVPWTSWFYLPWLFIPMQNKSFGNAIFEPVVVAVLTPLCVIPGILFKDRFNRHLLAVVGVVLVSFVSVVVAVSMPPLRE
jgi:hypothetical protein